MFRKMRRSRQQLTEKESIEILERNTAGVLAVHGEDGYPYGVPISYALADRCLYFHSARAGHKVDALAADPKACFTVIDMDLVKPASATTWFRSVICFGTVRRLTDNDEIRRAATLIGEKYCADYRDFYQADIEREFKALACYEFRIEQMSGKQAIELVNAHSGQEGNL